MARQIAAELIQRADTLMYEAKTRRSERVHATAVAVENGALVDITGVRQRSETRRESPLICPRRRADARIQSYPMCASAPCLGIQQSVLFSISSWWV